MKEYQIELKQLVEYPRCRIYRNFLQTLIADRDLHSNGGCGLFYFMVLYSFANFRSSYRRMGRTSYIVHPGEWVCSLSELTENFRLKYQKQAVVILEYLQRQNYISFTRLAEGRLIKYKITGWEKSNTSLEYNAPCQKDTGFFFFPITAAKELVSMGKCSELDIILDLWLHTIYKDERVQGSDIGPVVYYQNYIGDPFISYSELSKRWNISRSTVSRVLNKLDRTGYLTLVSGTGKKGSVVYLNSYLSTMFQVSDVLIDKEEVAMILCFNIQVKEETIDYIENEGQLCVSETVPCVSNMLIRAIVSRVAGILSAQGVSCCSCQHLRYKLYPYPGACKVKDLLELDISCREGPPLYRFEIKLSTKEEE